MKTKTSASVRGIVAVSGLLTQARRALTRVAMLADFATRMARRPMSGAATGYLWVSEQGVADVIGGPSTT